MENPTLDKIRIENTDVFFEDDGIGKGKLTISDIYSGAFTTYWGAMGDNNLKSFISSIDSDYFANRLSSNNYVFSAKYSVRNIRRAIKEEFNWYEEMEGQKELREKIKELESCENEYEFVNACEKLPDSLFLENYNRIDEQVFKNRIEYIFTCEPWNYIEKEPSSQYKWLVELHNKLKKILK